MFRSWLDESAGSAGVVASAVRVSVMMTPQGIPPRRARPTTSVLAHPPRVSGKEPWLFFWGVRKGGERVGCIFIYIHTDIIYIDTICRNACPSHTHTYIMYVSISKPRPFFSPCRRSRRSRCRSHTYTHTNMYPHLYKKYIHITPTHKYICININHKGERNATLSYLVEEARDPGAVELVDRARHQVPDR